MKKIMVKSVVSNELLVLLMKFFQEIHFLKKIYQCSPLNTHVSPYRQCLVPFSTAAHFHTNRQILRLFRTSESPRSYTTMFTCSWFYSGNTNLWSITVRFRARQTWIKAVFCNMKTNISWFSCFLSPWNQLEAVVLDLKIAKSNSIQFPKCQIPFVLHLISILFLQILRFNPSFQ